MNTTRHARQFRTQLSLAAAVALTLPFIPSAQAQSLPAAVDRDGVVSFAVVHNPGHWTKERLASVQPMPFPKVAHTARTAADRAGPSNLVQEFHPGYMPPNGDRPVYPKAPQPRIQIGSGIVPEAKISPNAIGGIDSTPFTQYRLFPDLAARVMPNIAIGQLTMSDPLRGVSYSCTAALIAKRLVLTAGHCVSPGLVNGNTRPYYYTNFGFSPGIMNGVVAPPLTGGDYGITWLGTVAYTSSSWYNGNGTVPAKQDIGIVVLNDRTDWACGYQGPHAAGLCYGWLPTRTNNVAVPFNITQMGYPSNIDTMRYMQVNNTTVTAAPINNAIVWGSPMLSGSSGGPIMTDYGVAGFGSPAWTANNSNTIISVASFGYENDPLRMVQGGSLLQPAKYPGGGFGDMYKTACAQKKGNC